MEFWSMWEQSVRLDVLERQDRISLICSSHGNTLLFCRFLLVRVDHPTISTDKCYRYSRELRNDV